MRNSPTPSKLRRTVIALLGALSCAGLAAAAETAADLQFESDVRDRQQRVAGFECEFEEQVRYSRSWLQRLEFPEQVIPLDDLSCTRHWHVRFDGTAHDGAGGGPQGLSVPATGGVEIIQSNQVWAWDMTYVPLQQG